MPQGAWKTPALAVHHVPTRGPAVAQRSDIRRCRRWPHAWLGRQVPPAEAREDWRRCCVTEDMRLSWILGRVPVRAECVGVRARARAGRSIPCSPEACARASPVQRWESGSGLWYDSLPLHLRRLQRARHGRLGQPGLCCASGTALTLACTRQAPASRELPLSSCTSRPKRLLWQGT